MTSAADAVRPGSLKWLRDQNQARIVEAVRTSPGMTRADLAAEGAPTAHEDAKRGDSE